ncbi:MAG TPA: type II toxin-antitoxin system death-on-curing family toxin [Terriglobales bacterium]|nr:type II toxin-antitoxin system death-on-curing family toxin [Terriglobales bacterium]
MKEPFWITPQYALIAHDQQLAEHGGQEGVRDMGGLESAIIRPQQLLHYKPEAASLARLAAAYAVGISRNHPFVDGNKRTALVVCFTFLKINGMVVTAEPTERYRMFEGLASGEITEQRFTKWLEKVVEPSKKSPRSST